MSRPKKIVIRHAVIFALVLGFLSLYSVLFIRALNRRVAARFVESTSAFETILANARWPAQRYNYFQKGKSTVSSHELELIRSQMLQISYGAGLEYFALRSVSGVNRVVVRRGVLVDEPILVHIQDQGDLTLVDSGIVIRPCTIDAVSYVCVLDFPSRRSFTSPEDRTYSFIGVPRTYFSSRVQMSLSLWEDSFVEPAVLLRIGKRVLDVNRGDKRTLFTSHREIDGYTSTVVSATISRFLIALLTIALTASCIVELMLYIWSKRLQSKLDEVARVSQMRSRLDYLSQIQSFVKSLVHDIRSPLSALAAITGTLDPERKKLLQYATDRIELIIQDMEKKERQIVSSIEVSVFPILWVLTEIIGEKKLEFPNLRIIIKREDKDVSTLCVRGGYSDFVRTISNLINNAAQAYEACNGDVDLVIGRESSRAYLEIRDYGKGIPAKILSNLRTENASFGKANGTGVGLSQARQVIRSMNGQISIESKLGVGTTVKIDLPLERTPPWVLPVVDFTGVSNIVVIDQDPAAPRLLESHIGETDLPVKWYPNPKVLDPSALSSRSTLFFVNSSFGNEPRKGLEFIQWHSEPGSRFVLLASNWYAEQLQRAAVDSGIKMIPPNFSTLEIRG